MMEFFCKTCSYKFETKPTIKEFHDAVYGPCSKNIAICPKCNGECAEFLKPKATKTGSDLRMPPCGNPGASCNCM